MKKRVVIGLCLFLVFLLIIIVNRDTTDTSVVDNSNKGSITFNEREEQVNQEQEEQERLPAISQFILGEDTVYQFLVDNRKDAEAILTAYLYYNNYSEYDSVLTIYEEFDYLFMESFCREVEERLRLTDNPEDITGDGNDVYHYYKCYNKTGYLGRIPEVYAEDLVVIANEVYVDESFDIAKVMYNKIDKVDYLSENIIRVSMSTLSGYSYIVEIILDAESNRVISIEEVKV